MKRLFVLLLAAAIIVSAALATTDSMAQQTKPATMQEKSLRGKKLRARLQSEGAALAQYRENLQGVLQFLSLRPDLFPGARQDEKRMLREEDKRVIRRVWQRLLDNLLALESLKQSNSAFYKITAKPLEREAFFIFYGAFLAQYRCALDFLAVAENNPSLDIVLNEPAPELGLQANTYADFKFTFLNVVIASKFAALTTAQAWYGDPEAGSLAAGIQADREFIWLQGKGTGEKLTAKNALAIVKKAGFATWLPVQQGVSEWMGDTKVWRSKVSLISSRQIREIIPQLEPGDMLFERREWYLSNVGLPGFWAHAAFFIGTPEERQKFFSGDEELSRWIKDEGASDGNLETLLKKKCPDAYAAGLLPQERKHLPRVLEAVSEGVSFTTLEHSAACDSLAVLRPRLSKKEKARAVLKAFQYSGRPYDFDFDFLTDASLVCSELIYKCYEPSKAFKGLTFPLQDMLGRKVTPPNDMVRQFDRQYGTPAQQTDFVLFYDGKEQERRAVPAPVEEFRKSWRRPKWHVLTREGNKKTPQD